MRRLLLLALVACSSKPAPIEKPRDDGSAVATPPDPVDKPPTPAIKKETLAADTPRTTVAGNSFIAPVGWSIWVVGPATIVESPERDSRIAFVDLPQAKDADDAVKTAWSVVKPDLKWKQLLRSESPDKDGWSKITTFAYEVPPNEKRFVVAQALNANNIWTVVIGDIAEATGEKRGGQLGLMFGQFLPKGGAIESFAGKKANPLDKARIDALTKFITDSQKLMDVEGVALGLIENGKVVFAGGFGVRERGKPTKVDADTKFIVASNTKALTTLMLAKLVDQKKLTWESTATSLLPEFKLGDADTTSKVLVKHLICACTGMPRQDMEWILEYKDLTPALVMKRLAGMQPTSKFGELFQYSNVMAAAAGFIGGHVAFPSLELGKAYDEAMRTLVFEPLGMKSTTFDFKRAMTGNYAMPHGNDVDMKPALALHAVNYSIIPVRPAGGAWSSVNDMLKYVQMELAEGALPNGKPYISKETLLARRAAQVSIGKDLTYGMGLMVGNRHKVAVVSHGGDIVGFHSDMIWIPDAKVGAVILTNSDRGGAIRSVFKRKLLEVLYDGKPEADAAIAAGDKNDREAHAKLRPLLTVPADPAEVAKLAARYTNPALGELAVVKKDGKTWFDMGEWKSEVATRKYPDGSVAFSTITPGIGGVELILGTGDKKTLVLRDAQHEYTFTER